MACRLSGRGAAEPVLRAVAVRARSQYRAAGRGAVAKPPVCIRLLPDAARVAYAPVPETEHVLESIFIFADKICSIKL